MNLRPIIATILGCAVFLLTLGCDDRIDPIPTPVPSPPSPASTATAQPSPTVTTPTHPPVPTSTPVPAPAPVATATAVPIPPTPRPTPDPRTRGGTLNLSTPQNIAHFDVHLDVSPALSTWGPGIAYSRLMRIASGPGVTLPSLAVECDLCLSWTMESPTSYRFELRPDAKWQDLAPVSARPVTADDIVYSYLRQSDPSYPNSALLQNVDEVHALDRSTVLISLDASDADGLLAFADGHSKVVAREAVELNGDLRLGPTVGSGPWILRRSAADDIHAFERNPDYYEPGIPLVDNLNLLVLVQATTRSAAFQTGYVDIINMEPDEWLKYVERVANAPHIAIPQTGSGVEVAFNTTLPPFDNIALRQAAMLAMEPVKAIEEHWGGFGSISHSFAMASAEWLIPQTELSRRFDRRANAKAVLSESGAATPIPVIITVGDFGTPYLHHAHAISVELQSLGFEVETEIVNRREFGERIWLGGEYQMMVGPPAPITVPNGYLLSVLHSDGIWNTTGHRDDVLDELLEGQAVESDTATRAELIRKVQERVLDQGYRFMPAATESIWTWRPHVRDFLPNFGAYEYHHWARVWLAN